MMELDLDVDTFDLGLATLLHKSDFNAVFGLFEALEKGAQHKYIKRIPTGLARPKYRYIYSVGSRHAAKGADPKVGEKIKVEHGGKQGHYEVTRRDGDYAHVKHDESGHEMRIHKDELHDLFADEHKDAVKAKHAKLKAVYENAKKNGTPAQAAYAKKLLDKHEKQWGLTSEATTGDGVAKRAAAELSTQGDYMGPPSSAADDFDAVADLAREIAAADGYKVKTFGDTISVSRMKRGRFIHEGNLRHVGGDDVVEVTKGNAPLRRIAAQIRDRIAADNSPEQPAAPEKAKLRRAKAGDLPALARTFPRRDSKPTDAELVDHARKAGIDLVGPINSVDLRREITKQRSEGPRPLPKNEALEPAAESGKPDVDIKRTSSKEAEREEALDAAQKVDRTMIEHEFKQIRNNPEASTLAQKKAVLEHAQKKLEAATAARKRLEAVGEHRRAIGMRGQEIGVKDGIEDVRRAIEAGKHADPDAQRWKRTPPGHRDFIRRVAEAQAAGTHVTFDQLAANKFNERGVDALMNAGLIDSFNKRGTEAYTLTDKAKRAIRAGDPKLARAVFPDKKEAPKDDKAAKKEAIAAALKEKHQYKLPAEIEPPTPLYPRGRVDGMEPEARANAGDPKVFKIREDPDKKVASVRFANGQTVAVHIAKDGRIEAKRPSKMPSSGTGRPVNDPLGLQQLGERAVRAHLEDAKKDPKLAALRVEEADLENRSKSSAFAPSAQEAAKEALSRVRKQIAQATKTPDKTPQSGKESVAAQLSAARKRDEAKVEAKAKAAGIDTESPEFKRRVAAYEAKIEAKRDRYEERADKAAQRAQSRFRAADLREEASGIPMGQPVLVGHHSEKRHRRALDRAANNMRAGIEESAKADYYRRKASTYGTRGISSDDPAAVIKLREKIEAAEAAQARNKALNRAIKKKDKAKGDAEIRAMFPDMPPEKVTELITSLRTPDFAGRIGIPSYELQNNNANIRRMKERVETLMREHQAGEKPDIEGKGFRIEEDKEANRIRLHTDEKPPKEVRDALKRRGFRWSRANSAWQRQLNDSARSAVEQVVKEHFGYEPPAKKDPNAPREDSNSGGQVLDVAGHTVPAPGHPSLANAEAFMGSTKDMTSAEAGKIAREFFNRELGMGASNPAESKKMETLGLLYGSLAESRLKKTSEWDKARHQHNIGEILKKLDAQVQGKPEPKWVAYEETNPKPAPKKREIKTRAQLENAIASKIHKDYKSGRGKDRQVSASVTLPLGEERRKELGIGSGFSMIRLSDLSDSDLAKIADARKIEHSLGAKKLPPKVEAAHQAAAEAKTIDQIKDAEHAYNVAARDSKQRNKGPSDESRALEAKAAEQRKRWQDMVIAEGAAEKQKIRDHLSLMRAAAKGGPGSEADKKLREWEAQNPGTTPFVHEEGAAASPAGTSTHPLAPDHPVAKAADQRFAEWKAKGQPDGFSADEVTSGESPYKPGDALSHEHNSPANAYVIDDYPYGRGRTQKRVWIETKPGKGQRLVSQTKNPKTGAWNKPKASTYSDAMAAVFDDKGHIGNHGISLSYSDGDKVREWAAKHGPAIKDPKIKNKIAMHAKYHDLRKQGKEHKEALLEASKFGVEADKAAGLEAPKRKAAPKKREIKTRAALENAIAGKIHSHFKRGRGKDRRIYMNANHGLDSERVSDLVDRSTTASTPPLLRRTFQMSQLTKEDLHKMAAKHGIEHSYEKSRIYDTVDLKKSFENPPLKSERRMSAKNRSALLATLNPAAYELAKSMDYLDDEKPKKKRKKRRKKGDLAAVAGTQGGLTKSDLDGALTKAIGAWEVGADITIEAASADETIDLWKASGPFVGPKGGKWADPQHKIPWKEAKHAGKPPPKAKQHDPVKARELGMHVAHTGHHAPMIQAIRKNLVNKLAGGKYDHAQAARAFQHAADAGSKSYAKEFGNGNGHHFDPATRAQAARDMADYFHEAAMSGEYDHLLHPKHAGKKPGEAVRQGFEQGTGGEVAKSLSVDEAAANYDGEDRYRHRPRYRAPIEADVGLRSAPQAQPEPERMSKSDAAVMARHVVDRTLVEVYRRKVGMGSLQNKMAETILAKALPNERPALPNDLMREIADESVDVVAVVKETADLLKSWAAKNCDAAEGLAALCVSETSLGQRLAQMDLRPEAVLFGR